MKQSPAYAHVSSCGRVVIGLVAPCGCCRYERELTTAELRDFVVELEAQVKIAQRVQQLPLPWIHEEGCA
jgi:hypothetical protein